MAIALRFSALVSLVLLYCACNRYTDRRLAREAITIAETIIDQQPDSALRLLQSIQDPVIMPEEQQMIYRLRLLQAKDKCALNITADTNIVEVTHYFKQRGDWPRAALAAFYGARVWQEHKNHQQAMKAYLDAEIYADYANNNKLKGMIQHNMGWIYYEQLAFRKSIAAYKKAVSYFQRIDSATYPRIVRTYQAISGNYIATKQLDSALHYNDKGLNLVQYYHDSTLLPSVYQNRAIIYREKGELLEAKKCLDKVFEYAPDEHYKCQLYITLIRFYKETQQFDLAVAYAEKSLQIFDSTDNSENLQATVYYLLSAIAQEQGVYKEALSYYRQYSDLLIKILQDIQNSSVVGLQEKYDLAMVKNTHQQLLIQHQHKIRILLWLLIVFILISFVFYYYYTRKRTALFAVKQQLAQLKVMAANYDDKDKTLKNILMRSFGIVKKLSLLESTLNQEEKKHGAKLLRRFKEIVFDTPDGNYWKRFYPAIDDFYNGHLNVIKDLYPSLDETEFKVCCLCLADFRNDEMAMFMNCSESTIRAKKTNIRKKTGIAQGGDLVEYLTRYL